ncbi:MAG: four helix bundle protein [Saprospiraceae bacterium]|nr:four helix bundle protein [Saprospiraceae bacterium]
MRNYKRFEIWQHAMEMAVFIYAKTEKIPKKENFNLISQMERAVVSISSNIAEGSGRKSNKDFHRFLEYALGSSYELETQLLLCKRLGYFNQNDLEKDLEFLDMLQKKLYKFISNMKITG